LGFCDKKNTVEPPDIMGTVSAVGNLTR